MLYICYIPFGSTEGFLQKKRGRTMEKLDKRINVGTKVKLKYNDIPRWFAVSNVNDTRVNFSVDGLCGAFQKSDVVKYSNTKTEEWRWEDGLFGYNHIVNATTHISTHVYNSTKGRVKTTIEIVETGRILNERIFEDENEKCKYFENWDYNSFSDFRKYIDFYL